MASRSPGVRSSKRQRLEVKYYDNESSDDGDESYDEVPPAKKRKSRGVKSKSLSKKKIFPFQILPAELRNRIYELALTDCDRIKIRCKQISYRGDAFRVIYYDELGNPDCSLNPKLLCLNKQIRSEAQAFLYAKNSLSFEDTKDMYTFLAGIGTRNVGLLTHLVIERFGARGSVMNNPAMTLLSAAVNLDVLDVEYAINDWFCKIRSHDLFIPDQLLRYFAKKFHKKAQYWLEARGEAALRALSLREKDSPTVAEFQVQSKLGITNAFKDELRRLMKR